MFDFQVLSYAFDVSNEGAPLITLVSNSSAQTATLLIQWDGSDLRLAARYYTDLAAWEYITGTSTAIALNTWYTATIEYESSTDLTVTVDTIGGGSPTTEINDAGNISSRDVRFYYLGAATATARFTESGDALEYEIDRVKIDDDTLPSQCATE